MSFIQQEKTGMDPQSWETVNASTFYVMTMVGKNDSLQNLNLSIHVQIVNFHR